MARALSDRSITRGPVTGTALRTPRRAPFFVEFYRSAVGKKWVMAITGAMLMGFVLAHMIGNLKLYLGASHFVDYAEFLRVLGEPIVPETGVLWILRAGLLAAFALHLHATYSLTMMNRRARSVGYQSKRDYVAANWASRSMRMTGPIVLLFLIWHLMDLTWGWVNPGGADVYEKVVESFSRVPVALLYIVANLALGVHLFHGAWSLFQSLGANNPRFNRWRRWFATAFAAVIVVGNVSFPIAVLAGIID
jgi:succinate dehydrogenase / fumarate reductase cytochrome b subunit